MVIKNKRGSMLESFGIIVMFSMMCISVFFLFYFLFVSGNNFVAIPLINSINSTDLNESMKAGAVAAGESYQETNLQMIDWGFLGSLISMTGLGLYISYYSRNLDYYSFIGLLTYGLMFLLFILGIILEYTNWLYNILINLFPTLVIDLPIFNWLLSNIGIYTLVLCSTMLLINQLDFDLAVINRRKDKENDVLNDEEIV
jgi:hypothetical protein